MWIRKLHIHNFGKLNNKEIELEDGINIIYGDNEAGKSTLHTFIKAMFFGVVRQRGRAAANDEYTKYKPWSSPVCYEGSMDFVYEDLDYRISRVFQKSTKSITLADLSNGRTVSTEDDCMEKLVPGMNESNYNSTVSVGQEQHEIGSIIANLNLSKSSEINVHQAMEMLNAQKRGLDRKNQALKIDELESRLKEYEQVQEELGHVISKQKLLQQEYESFSKEVETQSQNRKLTTKALLDKMYDILTIVAIVAFVAGVVTQKYLVSVFSVVLLIIVIGLALKLRKSINQDNSEVPEKSEISASKDFTSKDLDQRLKQSEYNLEKISWERDNLIARNNRREELVEELNEKYSQLEENRGRLQSISLALTTISKFSKSIESEFGDNLNDMASEYISRFTRGKYDNLRVMDGMKVSVSEESNIVDMSSVSYATREQIRLSVRLAASRILLKEEKIPIVLDEIFAHFDNVRLEDTLLSLSTMKTQMIIFTCTGREIAVLQTAGVPFNLVKLD